MPDPSEHIPVIDTHRHYIGKTMRARFVELGLWDGSKPLPQVNKDDIIFYKDFVDLDFSIEQQRAGGVTKALASGGGEVEWMAGLFGGDPVDTLKFLADERLEIRDAYPKDVDILVDALALDGRSLPIVERMVSDHGAKAVSISSSYGHGDAQRFLDSPKADWLWDYASAEKLIVHVHPPMISVAAEHLRQYRMIEAIGRPFDTALTAARMINAGVFDRFLDLQVLFVHMGGDVGPVLGRLDFNWRLNYDGIADPPENKVIKAKRRPSEYMRTNIYVDTMGFNEPGVRAAIAMCGIDRVVFGTDYGPVPISPKEHIDIVDAVAVDDAERAALLWGNADRIFGLGLATAG